MTRAQINNQLRRKRRTHAIGAIPHKVVYGRVRIDGNRVKVKSRERFVAAFPDQALMLSRGSKDMGFYQKKIDIISPSYK